MSYTELTGDTSPSHLRRISMLLAQQRFLVALTGAGISVASGIPLLSEEVAGVPLQSFFRPDLRNVDALKFFEVYRQLVKRWRSAKPNEAHYSLAAAQAWVITQNVDGLHRDAQTQRLIELHGNLRELRCVNCHLVFPNTLAWDRTQPVPLCPSCGSALEPGITLEGEQVRHFSRAVDWVGQAHALLVVGTRLNMYPVKQLAEIAKARGSDVIVINRDADRVVPMILEQRIESLRSRVERSREGDTERGRESSNELRGESSNEPPGRD